MKGGGTERHQTLPGGFGLLPAQGYNLTAPGSVGIRVILKM